MIELPVQLQPLTNYKQFVIHDSNKMPIDYRTGAIANAHDPNIWMGIDAALNNISAGRGVYGLGFVFTSSDPFWFLDIDGALQPDGQWSQFAVELCSFLSGAAIEVSQSNTGLHIIGSGTPPPHSCKNSALNIELYTEGRYCALTGKTSGSGSVITDLTPQITAIAAKYFPPTVTVETPMWTDQPVPEWNGDTNDKKLIESALKTTGAGSVFGGSCCFADLWTANVDALSIAYPPNPDSPTPYDASTADAALAQHLAFWTGNNHERIRALMLQSGLKRGKWDREDYLIRTITRAVSLQNTVYTAGAPDNTLAEKHGAPKLKAKSEKQRTYAENIRAKKLQQCVDGENIKVLCSTVGLSSSAKFWIDNQNLSIEEFVQRLKPITETAPPINRTPTVITGYQYLPADLQIRHFTGCVYVQDYHRIFTPSGSMLKADQFNAVYGGYTFQLDESGDKTTRKAWEAFTESQIVRYPKSEGTCFRPEMPSGEIITEEGKTFVNVYVPVEINKITGDPEPFITLLKKILPVKRDRDILLSYMAACIQYKGIKFQWAPLIQGTEGNGKTLLTRCVARAIGKRYTHYPKAADLDNKFNSWLLNKLFIGVEDVYVPDNRREVIETLKPMITSGDGIEIQCKGVDQITADICANFMLNSNHRDAIQKTQADRRFAVFYTAQQSAEDLIRDGMDGDYFPNLYKWLKSEGYAIVADYLHTYKIPDALNPATKCQRAPETSTTQEAISASRGSVEQEILEAIDENRPGFIGGWISSMALERLLQNMRMSRRIPHNKRRELLKTLGYDWHPHLNNGRVNNPINLDGGKPRLFVRSGHIALNITVPKDIAAAYEAEQCRGVGVATGVFSAAGGR